VSIPLGRCRCGVASLWWGRRAPRPPATPTTFGSRRVLAPSRLARTASLRHLPPPRTRHAARASLLSPHNRPTARQVLERVGRCEGRGRGCNAPDGTISYPLGTRSGASRKLRVGCRRGGRRDAPEGRPLSCGSSFGCELGSAMHPALCNAQNPTLNLRRHLGIYRASFQAIPLLHISYSPYNKPLATL
jgi:hypothetical protein